MSVPMSVKGESSDVRGIGREGEGKGPGRMVRVRGSDLGRLEACLSILVFFFFFLNWFCVILSKLLNLSELLFKNEIFCDV